MFSFPQLIPANASAEFQGQSLLQSTSGNAPAPNATTSLVNGTPGVENLQSDAAPSSSEQTTRNPQFNANTGEIQTSTNNFVANPTTPQSIVAASTPQVTHASASPTTNSPSVAQPTKIDYAISATTTTLTGLKAIAGTSLVPGLSQAAGTASQLLDMLMIKKQNDAGIQDIAKDISGLIICIYDACKSDSDTRAVSQEFSQDIMELASCLQSLGDVCTRYEKRRWLNRFTFSLLWKSRIEDVRRKVQECIRKFELKNTISIRKFHDVWREANHATTSQLKVYIDAIVSNTTQGSVENRPRPSLVDNSYKGAKVSDRAHAFNGGYIGFEPQATANLSLPTTGTLNTFQDAEISDHAKTFSNCQISAAALQLWG